jgi:hypothetical protein
MSVQPPAAPHRVSITDIDISFWRMVAILIKWSFAAIPAAIVISIIYGLIGAAIVFVSGGLSGNLQSLFSKWI